MIYLFIDCLICFYMGSGIETKVNNNLWAKFIFYIDLTSIFKMKPCIMGECKEALCC